MSSGRQTGQQVMIPGMIWEWLWDGGSVRCCGSMWEGHLIWTQTPGWLEQTSTRKCDYLIERMGRSWGWGILGRWGVTCSFLLAVQGEGEHGMTEELNMCGWILAWKMAEWPQSLKQWEWLVASRESGQSVKRRKPLAGEPRGDHVDPSLAWSTFSPGNTVELCIVIFPGSTVFSLCCYLSGWVDFCRLTWELCHIISRN